MELTLRVITPESVALDTTASSVRIPALDGQMGILPRHASMVAALEAGVLTWTEQGASRAMFVSGGFAEVRDNTVRVVSEAGERPEDIDTERAQRAAERARERLRKAHGGDHDVDVLRAELALRRAIMRERVASGLAPGLRAAMGAGRS